MKSHRGRITNKKAFRVAARRYLQVRAEELKNLEEKRAALVEEMEGILNKAQEEERAFEESEQARFDEIEKEINAIDKTIEAKERARNLGNPGGKKKEDGENDDLTVEERAFVDYVRGTLTNERAANLTYADNGAVIPSSIVNKIIEKVVEICPIYSMADRYNIGGTINIPYYDEETSSIKMAFALIIACKAYSEGVGISWNGHIPCVNVMSVDIFHTAYCVGKLPGDNRVVFTEPDHKFEKFKKIVIFLQKLPVDP